jgi:hypothetical protein
MKVYEIWIISYENDNRNDVTFKVVGDNRDSVSAYAEAYRKEHFGTDSESYIGSVRALTTELVGVVENGTLSHHSSAFISYEIIEFFRD